MGRWRFFPQTIVYALELIATFFIVAVVFNFFEAKNNGVGDYIGFVILLWIATGLVLLVGAALNFLTHFYDYDEIDNFSTMLRRLWIAPIWLVVLVFMHPYKIVRCLSKGDVYRDDYSSEFGEKLVNSPLYQSIAQQQRGTTTYTQPQRNTTYTQTRQPQVAPQKKRDGGHIILNRAISSKLWSLRWVNCAGYDFAIRGEWTTTPNHTIFPNGTVSLSGKIRFEVEKYFYEKYDFDTNAAIREALDATKIDLRNLVWEAIDEVAREYNYDNMRRCSIRYNIEYDVVVVKGY